MLAKILFYLTLLVGSAMGIDCNATHFQFFSNYSLGKQQQLNLTFTEIQPLIKLPTIAYNETAMVSYTLSNAVATFRYLDSKQQAVIIGKDTIGVYGGRLQVVVAFEWTQKNLVVPVSGTGTARITSEEIMFEKLLQMEQGYLDYKLAFYYNISFEYSNFTILRIDPPTTSDTIKAAIVNALNGANQNVSLRKSLQDSINSLYATSLQKYLKNEHYPLDDHFDYTYQNPWSGRNITLNFMLVPTGYDLEKDGLSLTFVSYIKDDSKWKCGKMIPTQELNPQIYGGIQEFLSFSIIQNSIRYAFEKGFLNTVLDKKNWESKFFQFYAGDLYEVIPQIANKFIAMLQVQGNCTNNPMQQIVVKKSSNSTINTTTSHTCGLFVASNKVAEFQIKLDLIIQVLSNQTYLNFRITHAEGRPTFKTISNFQVKNKDLAEHMITHCLNRLKQGHTFGSGWKIFPRDYSHVLIEDDYLIIYDSTHVGGEQQTLQ